MFLRLHEQLRSSRRAAPIGLSIQRADYFRKLHRSGGRILALFQGDGHHRLEFR